MDPGVAGSIPVFHPFGEFEGATVGYLKVAGVKAAALWSLSAIRETRKGEVA